MLNFKNVEIGQPTALVTIGITSYNYSKYIIEALNSVIEQTYPEIEVIIIDDCSTDDCPQKISGWISENNINCVYIHHQQNNGITKTLNEIVHLSNGKYIVFFATDDLMLPERVASQVAVMETAGEEFGLCYTRPQFMDEEGLETVSPFKNRTDTIYEGDVLIDFITREFGFVSPTAMINKIVYNKVGLYDERVLIEDYNFYIRFVACYKVIYCSYPGIIYRVKKRGSSVFTEAQKNNYERYYHDRIISNAEALKFISDKTAQKLIIDKINQYLKSLAVNNSVLYWKSFTYLLRKKVFRLSLKSVITKILKKKVSSA